MKIHRLSAFANAGLRLASLLAKLGLSLYMGRFLPLSDIGIYGLVFAVVMTTTVFLGFRMDYVSSREMVRAEPIVFLSKFRDQSVFYFYNYLIGLVLFIAACLLGVIDMPPKLAFYATLLVIFESYANLLYVSHNAMEKQVVASTIFFVRSGAWVFTIVLAGLLFPSLRNADSIIEAWVIGCAISIIITFWTWRHLPWNQVISVPINWGWVKTSVKKSLFIWLGAMGLSVGAYIDRFVVNSYLGLDQLGIVTFYFSFTNALLTLVQSGVLTFANVRLVAYHRHNEHDKFWHDTWHTLRQIIISSTVFVLAIGICVPLLGKILHRPGFVNEAFTLWLMLAGVWLRAIAEVFYYVLFAAHQDRAVWLGNLLFLIPACGCNLLFVPIFGLPGIGYGAIVSSLCLLAWRLTYLMRFRQEQINAGQI